MLAEFNYLGAAKAKEVVIDNTRAIAAQIENIELLPDEPAMPEIPGAPERLVEMSYSRAKEVYGDPLPQIVEDRLRYELDSIITHGYGVLYYIAYELVHHSMEDGYLVGSRGSVGSSFTATMAGITEVNALPPHYVCPNCKKSEFISDPNVACGPDLPSKNCPDCGTEMRRDGYEIPFAVFLGINADKVPDIDLNFSGENQQSAHQFIIDYFGEDRVFRAGTISSVKEQTAYGFVKKYMDEKGIPASRATRPLPFSRLMRYSPAIRPPSRLSVPTKLTLPGHGASVSTRITGILEARALSSTPTSSPASSATAASNCCSPLAAAAALAFAACSSLSVVRYRSEASPRR
jgi:DNA polymerase-3 subunit alpha (Gram-positive type)